MKAFLLAAGLGTRLKPLTLSTPKCLIPILNKPLLAWWIDLFIQHNIKEVLINLHHLPEQVKEFLIENNRGIKFFFFEEERLLGSGGSLRENKWFVKNENEFFIFYADNLTNYDFTEFLSFHRNHYKPFSMALFRTETPHSKGISELNKDDTIINFVEKPSNPVSNLANAGMYIASPELLDLIPEKEIADIGFDLLPKLVGKMKGWIPEKGYLRDIGTHEDLKIAQIEWSKIIKPEGQ